MLSPGRLTRSTRCSHQLNADVVDKVSKADVFLAIVPLFFENGDHVGWVICYVLILMILQDNLVLLGINLFSSTFELSA